jgi:DNA-binding CsgD family transcriptional regulator
VGALADAEADAAIATRTADAPLERLFRPLATAVRIEVLIERGSIAEAPADPDAGDSIYAALHAYALARLACAERRHEEGAEALLRAGERLTRLGATSPSAAAWRSEAALALLALGRDAEAREHAAEELRLARELGTAPRALGIALRAAGLANRDSDLLAEACAVLAPSPARLEHARALTDHGAALRRAGRRAEAREQLKGALDIATRLGATSLQERATTELKAAGGRPRKPFRTGREALTASELRVAELAAGGMTNRQIAQALFVTPRTVEGHLTQVYGKLGASGRSGLADALADRP